VRFAGDFHAGEDCATGIRSCGAIGDRGSIDAIGSAILLGVGARNQAICRHSSARSAFPEPAVHALQIFAHAIRDFRIKPRG
jgi:hypothetical protein